MLMGLLQKRNLILNIRCKTSKFEEILVPKLKILVTLQEVRLLKFLISHVGFHSNYESFKKKYTGCVFFLFLLLTPFPSWSLTMRITDNEKKYSIDDKW